MIRRATKREAGHRVVGRSRSDAGAASLARAGAELFGGDVKDGRRLRTAASSAEGVIHAAFNRGAADLKQSSEEDRTVIETLGEVPAGSNRLVVITSGAGLGRSKTGGPAVAADDHVTSAAIRRAACEAADAPIAKGGRVMVMRPPQERDVRRQRRISQPIRLARGDAVDEDGVALLTDLRTMHFGVA